jgi:hypothetical protein
MSLDATASKTLQWTIKPIRNAGLEMDFEAMVDAKL